MSIERKRKSKEIVMNIGHRFKTIQGVTEQTTCGDVIKMVLRKSESAKEGGYSYAIFENGNGHERMLSDKTKILKTMRSWGSDTSFHFNLKAVKGPGKILKAKQDKLANRTALNNLNVNDKMENAGKFAQFVQSPKTRLQRHQTRSHVAEVFNNDGERNIDEFTCAKKVDQDNVVGFPDYCGSVTANELVRLSGKSDSATLMKNITEGFVCGKEISKIDKTNDVKYATKKVLKPERTSVTYGHGNNRMPRKHTYVDCKHKNIPLHSTPNRSSNQSIKRHEELANDITTKITRTSQKEGKDVILQKYFSDYLSYNSPHGKPFTEPIRQRGDGASFTSGNPDKGDGTFSIDAPSMSKTARARRHSDCDSGQEDHEYEDILDNAFILATATKRMDSSPRYAVVKCLSGKLVNYDVTVATKVNKLVDYSFSDSSILGSDKSSVDIAERNIFDEDEEMASFMDSKLHDDCSDEGLSSLDSDDEKEFFV